MINHLLNKLNRDNDYVICVTGDHTTPCILGDHTYEPVPVVVSTFQNYLVK
jgi:2,3-bisphosphoglycerate-independent phosphoglycerate mutase